MDEEAVKTMYSLAQQQGYQDSQADFEQLLATDAKALGTMYGLAQDKGYADDLESFEILMGLKKKEEPVVTESVSDGGSSEQRLASRDLEAERMSAFGAAGGGRVVDSREVPQEGYKSPAEIAKRDSAKTVINTREANIAESQLIQRQEEAQRITADLPPVAMPEGSVTDALQQLRDLYGPYGLQFSEEKVPAAMSRSGSKVVKATVPKGAGGKPVEVRLELDEDGNINPSEASKVDALLRENARYVGDTDESFVEKAIAVQELRSVPRIDSSGVSTVKMASAEVDGKFIAYPTLFPKDPAGTTSTNADDWVELDFGIEAQNEAFKRGEVFYFDTEEEARAFGEGAWKGVVPMDLEFQKRHKEMGRDYDSDMAFLDELTERRDEYKFIEDLPVPGARYEEGLIPASYQKYFIDGNMVRDDIETMRDEKEAELSMLEAQFDEDNVLLRLKEDRDVALGERYEQLSTEAAEINTDAKLRQNQLQAESLKNFGVRLEDLATYEPKTEEELRGMIGLYNDYNQAASQRQAAALGYERAQTYYDKQYDKGITQDYVDGWEEVGVAWDNGWKRGEAMSKLLLMQMGYYNVIGDEGAEEQAMREVSEIMDSQDPRRGRLVSRANMTGTTDSYLASIASNPGMYTAAITAESLGQLVPIWARVLPAAAVTGAVYGAVAGPGGSIVGTLGGIATGALESAFMIGMPISELALEMGNATLEVGERMGYDWSDPNSALKALNDEKLWADATQRGLERGIPIASMGVLSNFFIGAAVGRSASLASTGERVLRGVGTGLIAEPATEALGEYMAIQTTGEYTGSTANFREIMSEAIGAVGMGVGMGASFGALGYAKQKLQESNFNLAVKLMDPMSLGAENVSGQRIMNWANKMEKLGQITPEQAEYIRKNTGYRRQANELLGRDVDARPGTKAKVVGRLMQLLEAKDHLSKPGTSFAFGRKLSEINEEISYIAENQSNRSEQVDLSLIDTRTRQSQPGAYKFNGKNVSRQDFLNKLQEATPRQLRKASVYNDSQVAAELKTKLDAISKREAAQVPVGKRTGFGSEVDEEVREITQEVINEQAEGKLDEDEIENFLAPIASKKARGEKLTELEQQFAETNSSLLKRVEKDLKELDKLVSDPNAQEEEGVSVIGKLTDRGKAVGKQARKAAKALRAAFPEVKIVLHTDDASFIEAAKGVGLKGTGRAFYGFDSKEIHVHTGRAKNTTVAHEAFHAALRNSVDNSEVQALMGDFVTTLKKVIPADSELAAKLDKFARDYKENRVDEEYVAEFFGELAAAYPTLDRKGKTAIARFLERLSNLIGIDLTLTPDLTKRDEQILSLLETLAGKVSRGKAIKGKQVSQLQELARSTSREQTEDNLGAAEQKVSDFSMQEIAGMSENGVVGHFTNETFDKFLPKFMKTGVYGAGFYFTGSTIIGKHYGKGPNATISFVDTNDMNLVDRDRVATPDELRSAANWLVDNDKEFLSDAMPEDTSPQDVAMMNLTSTPYDSMSERRSKMGESLTLGQLHTNLQENFDEYQIQDDMGVITPLFNEVYPEYQGIINRETESGTVVDMVVWDFDAINSNIVKPTRQFAEAAAKGKVSVTDFTEIVYEPTVTPEERMTEMEEELIRTKPEAETALRAAEQRVQTGTPFTFEYNKNPEPAPQMATQFGQDVEAAGDYVTQSVGFTPEGFETGTVTVQSPLIVDITDDTQISYKNELSNRYGGATGEALSNAIRQDGYDAIVTRFDDGSTGEIVLLGGQRPRAAEQRVDDLDTSIGNSVEFAEESTFDNKIEFKRALQERFNQLVLPELEARYGITDSSELNDNLKEYLVDAYMNETLNAIAAYPDALGWYDSRITGAMSLMSLLHPELATDPDAASAFKIVLAITSNGNKVYDNFVEANRQYKYYKENGRFDESRSIGNQVGGILSNLKFANEALGVMSMAELTQFLTTKHKVGSLSYRDSAGNKKNLISGFGINEEVYGAAVFGPKIGNGFFMNLYGVFDQLTMDRWFMRQYGRLTGTLLDFDQKKVDTATKRLARARKALLQRNNAKVETLIGAFENLSDAELAQKVQKASMDIKKRAVLKSNPKLDEFRKASNNLAKLLEAEVEAPTPAKRRFINEVFSELQRKLKDENGIDITIADLQAVNWYPEKALYQTFKADQTQKSAKTETSDNEQPDYESAARKLVEKQGVTKEQIDGRQIERDDTAREADQQRAAELLEDDEATSQLRDRVLSIREEVTNDDLKAAEQRVDVDTEGPTIVYRSGAVDSKAEPRGMMDGKGRSTGHFGTGAYFFSDRKRAEEYDDREVTAVDTRDYNLAPASKELHDELRGVNDLYNPSTQDFREKDEFSSRDFFGVIMALGRYDEFYTYEQLDMDASDEVLLAQQRRNSKVESRRENLMMDAKAMYNEPGNVDSRSTVVMKVLGYDGVYATPGSDMDTFQYGTVIYDVKTEPKAAEQIVVEEVEDKYGDFAPGTRKMIRIDGGRIEIAGNKTFDRSGIIELFVPEESRRQGIGTRLVERAIEEADGKLVGMASKDAAIDINYRLGMRYYKPEDGTEATLEETKKQRAENSYESIFMQTPEARQSGRRDVAAEQRVVEPGVVDVLERYEFKSNNSLKNAELADELRRNLKRFGYGVKQYGTRMNDVRVISLDTGRAVDPNKIIAAGLEERAARIEEQRTFEAEQRARELEQRIIEIYEADERPFTGRDFESQAAEQKQKIEAMSQPDDTMRDVVAKGREMGFRDSAIRAVLMKRYGRDSTEAINTALAEHVDMFTVIPKAFGDVVGGLEVGRQMYGEVRAKLNEFMRPKSPGRMTKQQRADRIAELRNAIAGGKSVLVSSSDGSVQMGLFDTGNVEVMTEAEQSKLSDTQLLRKFPRPKTTPTRAEMMAEALEILKDNRRFKEQPEKVQKELLVGFSTSLKSRANKGVQNLLSQIRRDLNERKKGAKTAREVQKQLRTLINEVLPKADYSKSQVAKLTKVVNEVNEDNYIVKAQKVLDLVEQKREQIRRATIKEIAAFVKRSAKTYKTPGGRIRTRGLDAPGRAFFLEANRVLTAVFKKDQTDIMNIGFNLATNPEVDIATAKLMNGENLTVKEQMLLDQKDAYDLFAPMADMSLEQVEAVLEDLKVTAGFSRVNLKNIRMERAARLNALRQGAKDSVEGNWGGVVTKEVEKDGETKIVAKDSNDLATDRANKKSFKDIMLEGGLQDKYKALVEWSKETKRMTPSELIKNARWWAHLGTITSVMGEFFNENIYNKINRMKEQNLRGEYAQKEKLNDIANSIDGITNGYEEITQLIFTGGKTRVLTADEQGLTLSVKAGRRKFTTDELMRIYALSKSPIQRAKLERQGFTDEVMADIEEFLDPRLTEFVDKTVEYLSNEYYEGVNDVYVKVNDVNLGYMEGYFPTRTQFQGDLATQSKDQLLSSTYSGPNSQMASALKERVDTGSDILMNEGIGFHGELGNHINTMERFKAYSVGVQEINAILSDSFTVSLSELLGMGKVLNDGVSASIMPDVFKSDLDFKTIDKWQSRFVMSALAFKPMQIVKQMTSAIAGVKEYQYGEEKNLPVDILMFSMDFARLLPKLILEGVSLGKYKGPVSTMIEDSATLRRRIEDNFGGDLYGLTSGVSGRTRRVTARDYTLASKALKGLARAGGTATSAGDVAGVMGYLPAYMRDIQNGMSKEEAIEKFNQYNKTQQSRRESERSPIQTKQDGVRRLLTAFTSSQLLYLNELVTTANNMNQSVRKGERIKASDSRGFALALVGYSAMFMLATSMWQLMFGDDEEKERAWKRVLISPISIFYVIPLIGPRINQMANWFTGDNYPTSIAKDPYERVTREVIKSVKDEDYLNGVMKATEFRLGTNLDMFRGMMDIAKGQPMDESFYDVMGVPKSQRPED